MLQVVDATNTTRERRKLLFEIIQVKHKFKLFFIESICDDPTIVEANVLVGPIILDLDLLLQELSFFFFPLFNKSDDDILYKKLEN